MARARLWGPMPLKNSIQHVKQNVDLEIFVDGGIEHFKNRFHPAQAFWIGDADSLKKNLPSALLDKHRIFLNPEKSFSDLQAALKTLPNQKSLTIDAFGFMGGRIDHEFINLGCACSMMKKRKWQSITFWNPTRGKDTVQSVHILNQDRKHSFKFLGTFSIFSFKKQKVHLTGQLQYSGMINLPAHTSLGLSNFAHGTFHIKPSSPLILFMN